MLEFASASRTEHDPVAQRAEKLVKDTETQMAEIVANSVLPAARERVWLRTSDGETLIGELATPLDRPATSTLVCVHPLPTHGGMMDSHILRKAAWRLPALADVAVLRFNTRGTRSRDGDSTGAFDAANGEGLDLSAAVEEVVRRGFPDPWLLGWSFGTDVVLMHGNLEPVVGAILLSPPLRFATDDDLDSWAVSGRPLVALVPELDDYLRPAQAARRFARVPQAAVISVDGAKHLWVGEPNVRIVLNKVVEYVSPSSAPLPLEWDGPMDKWSDL